MKKNFSEAQNPLILRFHRLLEAFAKSDDERDFYIDRVEGFICYVDLDKPQEDLLVLEQELLDHAERYCLIPKMTFFETKKFMEGFVNEKVYDIDTKEKLLDIIASKEARENFLEFVYDHLAELEKWQQFYHERSRIRIIEWLRDNHFKFVFEEDLDLVKPLIEKLKSLIFEGKVPKDVQQGREALEAKAKTYYSNEALNPRPKRGRPPKQTAKVEFEPQLTLDIYKTVPSGMRQFLFLPEYNPAAATFSAKFNTRSELMASLKGSSRVKVNSELEALSQRLESLRHLSSRLKLVEGIPNVAEKKLIQAVSEAEFETDVKAAPKRGRIAEIASGLLPKRASKEAKAAIEEPKNVEHKQVTQIKKKK